MSAQEQDRREATSRWLASGFGCAAAIAIVVTIAGVVIGYDPVPFWDAWDGQVVFLDAIAAGDWGAWWRPHNEHRIVLARVLFWLDGVLGNGNGVLLLGANLACVAAVCLLLARALQRVLSGDAHRRLRSVLTALIAMALFAWMQRPNFTAGFQVQFFLAQVLPLAAMSTLAQAPTSRRPWRTIAMAALLGGLSLGTMASGMFVLPVLAAMAVAIGLGWRAAGALALLGALGGWCYVADFGDGSATTARWLAAASMPVALLRFVAAVLGSPAFWTVHGRVWQAEIAGAGYVLALALLLVRWRRGDGPVVTAMLATAGTTVLAGIAAAMGRVHMGLEVACSPRYTTAALVGWCALAVAAAPWLSRLAAVAPRRLYAAIAAVALLLLARQYEVVRGDRSPAFVRGVAAVALELEVHDRELLAFLHEQPDRLPQLSAAARAHDRFCFGLPPLRGLREAIGQPCPVGPEVALVAAPAIRSIPGDDRFCAVECTLASTATDIWLVDADGRCVGFARGAVRNGTWARGYVAATARGGTLRAVAVH